MNQIFSLSISLVFFTLASQSALLLWEHNQAEGMINKSEELMSKERIQLTSDLNQTGDMLDVNTRSSVEAHHKIARVYRSLGEKSLAEKSLDSYCKSLSHFGMAVSGEPRNSKYVIDWANLRQLLGNRSCPQELTNGDYQKAIDFALENSPVNPDIHFSAALLSEWSNKRDLALDYYKKFLDNSTDVSEYQQQFILAAINEPEDLNKLIPARFPHVVRWAAIFASHKSRRMPEYQKAFAALQRRALKDLVKKYESGAVPEIVYRNHILSLVDHVASDGTRRLLDALLAEILADSGDSKMSAYYSWRSKLSELAIVRTRRASDRRPKKSSLAIWGIDPLVALDKRSSTLGFFLADKQSAAVIELRGNKGGRKIDPADISVLVSVDNVNWSEVFLDDAVVSTMVEGYPMLSIKIDVGDYKFWKIHFTGPGQQQFSNYLSKLLRVFGQSARKTEL